MRVSLSRLFYAIRVSCSRRQRRRQASSSGRSGPTSPQWEVARFFGRPRLFRRVCVKEKKEEEEERGPPAQKSARKKERRNENSTASSTQHDGVREQQPKKVSRAKRRRRCSSARRSRVFALSGCEYSSVWCVVVDGCARGIGRSAVIPSSSHLRGQDVHNVRRKRRGDGGCRGACG